MAVKKLQSNTPTSTPKLALSSLPPRDTPGSKTPPFGSSLSVPFQWEEAPGKPRTGFFNSGKTHVARCLELPPRLMTDLPSPTTVLEWPDLDPCRNNPLSPGRSICSDSMSRRRWKLGSSWRWGSFREVRVLAAVTGTDDGEAAAAAGGVKLKRKSKSSFINNITNIRARIKHVVTWRRKEQED